MKHVCGAMAAAMALVAFGGLAQAQDQDFLDALEPAPAAVPSSDIGDCIPSPIEGTVPFLNAFKARKTNAQLFGTVGFFERVMRAPSPLRGEFSEDLGLDYDADDPPVPMWAWEVNVITNAVRLPVVNGGSGCGRDLRYGLQGLDLYAANSALRIPLLEFEFGDEQASLGLFSAGGVTASVLQNGNRFFQTYQFAAIGLLGTYLPPAVLAFEDDAGFQRVTGDFILGAEADLGSYGDVYLGYAFNRGLYTNLTVPKIKFFASVLVAQELQSLPLLQAGFQAIKLIDALGSSALWTRRQQLSTGAATQSDDPEPESLRLTTGNYSQTGIELGAWARMDLSLSYAVEPEPFLHKLHGSIYTPGFKESLFGFRVDFGLIDFPEAPFLGVEGGQRLSVVADLGLLRVGYNDPNLFEAFPYARDFFNVNFKIAF